MNTNHRRIINSNPCWVASRAVVRRSGAGLGVYRDVGPVVVGRRGNSRKMPSGLPRLPLLRLCLPNSKMKPHRWLLVPITTMTKIQHHHHNNNNNRHNKHSNNSTNNNKHNNRCSHNHKICGWRAHLHQKISCTAARWMEEEEREGHHHAAMPNYSQHRPTVPSPMMFQIMTIVSVRVWPTKPTVGLLSTTPRLPIGVAL